MPHHTSNRHNRAVNLERSIAKSALAPKMKNSSGKHGYVLVAQGDGLHALNPQVPQWFKANNSEPRTACFAGTRVVAKRGYYPDALHDAQKTPAVSGPLIYSWMGP
jgi:hypothetical protein